MNFSKIWEKAGGAYALVCIFLYKVPLCAGPAEEAPRTNEIRCRLSMRRIINGKLQRTDTGPRTSVLIGSGEGCR